MEFRIYYCTSSNAYVIITSHCLITGSVGSHLRTEQTQQIEPVTFSQIQYSIMSGSHRKTGGTKLSNRVTGQTKKRKANDAVDATDQQMESHQPAPKLLKSEVTTPQITQPVLQPNAFSSATVNISPQISYRCFNVYF